MDSTTRTKLRARLVDEIDVMPPMLQHVAKYIVDRPADFGLDTIRTSAQKIGVSANTLVRMASFLGFDSFEDLRAPFRQALLSGGVDGDWASRQSTLNTKDQDHRAAIKNEISVFNRSLQLLTPDLTQGVVTDLIGARNAFISATRSSYALAHYFHYIGRMAVPGMKLVPRHMGSAIEDMAELDTSDVLFAITFLPYSAETIQALRYANAKGAKVILMTDSELVAPNVKVDHLLRVTTQSTHYFGCYSGAMAVLDCLIASLVKKGGAEATARIAKYEDLRQDSGAYWKPSLPRVKT